jgi:hypothetical protein
MVHRPGIAAERRAAAGLCVLACMVMPARVLD